MADNDIRNSVAMNVYYYRNAKNGITQKQLAAKSGISTNTIYLIEHEKMNAGIDVLEKLAKGLGVDVINFFRTV
ncbi:helix-turn-helix domain-containing protein [Enterococcus sp. LJL120]